MVEHRQVVAFFAAMDGVIAHDPPGTWLAVTSLSFDISVLELLWTLTRGFHVIVAADKAPMAAVTNGDELAAAELGGAGRHVSCSTSPRAERSARATGCCSTARASPTSTASRRCGRPSATSTPSAACIPTRRSPAPRSPPSPSGCGSAPAACVLPLHHPMRVAEEWAVVDNLSGGRVGISFASGWQPNDFVLQAARTSPNAKQVMVRDIDVVRRLWRGETVRVPGHDGQAGRASRTLPRPVQPELPVWLTAAGSPATFERGRRSRRRRADPPARPDASRSWPPRSPPTARPGARPATPATATSP